MERKLFDVNGKINLYLVGDVHIPRGCIDKFRDVVDEIRCDKNALMIGMGDWIEGIIPSDPRYHPEEISRGAYRKGKHLNMLQKQYNLFESCVSPISDKILGLHSGNHDENLVKRYSFNELRSICERLDVDYYGNGTVVTDLRFPADIIRVQSSHGCGGGVTVGASYNRLERTSKYFEGVDIVAKGHTHKLGVNVSVPPLRFDDNGDLYDDVQFQCQTGSFLTNYDQGSVSYGERAEYAPLPIGFVKVFIDDGVVTAVVPVPL